MLKWIREASPSVKARFAGGLFLLVILTAAFTQFFIRGRLGFAADLSAGLIEVSGMIAVTLLSFSCWRRIATPPVSNTLTGALTSSTPVTAEIVPVFAIIAGKGQNIRQHQDAGFRMDTCRCW